MEMLRRYTEAQEPLSGRSQVPGSGDRLPLMPPTWNDSYRELERCLRQLRDTRPTCYWHLCERFIRTQDLTLELPVRRGRVKLPPHTEVAAGHVSIGAKTAKLRCRRWSSSVREQKVRLALAWLVREFRGMPFLPLEFTELAA